MEKWLVLAAGFVIQTVMGGIYAWSEFAVKLHQNYNLSRGECGAIFGLTIAIFTLAMVYAGSKLHTWGPKMTASIGALFFIAGYLTASFSQGNFALLLLGFALLTGAGTGFAYVCPLTVGMKWFPDNRGLVTGFSVAGFGGGAIVLSAVSEYLIHDLGYNLMVTFRMISFIFGGCALIAASFLSEPSSDEEKHHAHTCNIPLHELILTKNFALTAFGMFSGTFAGLLIISNLKSIMLAADFSEYWATISISLFAAGNITGRILWGQIHDRIGSRKTIIAGNFLFIISLLPLLSEDLSTWSLPAIPLIGMVFGSCFVIYASTIVEIFGHRKFAGLYPFCFLAYGFAALTGPALGGLIADQTGSFSYGIITGLVALAIHLLLFAVGFGRTETSAQPDSPEESTVAWYKPGWTILRRFWLQKQDS